jgi:xanthine dehydrogenase YagR molybdenum-binding subunit
MARDSKAVGKPVSRVDGRLKVTGAARYAAEAALKDVAHAVLVGSTIARGRITSLDTAAAEKAPGVLAVISHRNAAKVVLPEKAKAMVDPAVGRPLQPLQDDRVHYHGQPIAVVVADTLDRARQAATLVRARYREERAVTEFEEARPFRPGEPKAGDRPTKKPADYHRGAVDRALAGAEVRLEHTYTIPAEYHNPMEMHATTAAWDGPKLTLYDKTQWVDNVQRQAAAAFGIGEEDPGLTSSSPRWPPNRCAGPSS